MGRADSLVRLAWAYGLHLARRRVRRTRSQLREVYATYNPEGIRALAPAERERHLECVRLRARTLQDLRVIHILYTVCGDHTTSCANGQEIVSTTPRLAGVRDAASATRRAVHDVAGG